MKEIIEKMISGTANVVSVEALEEKLKKHKNLRIKFGADPSAPDLHLGHFVVMRKLRQFQDIGHTVVLIIGDFTAMIGDPSGRSKTRKMLSRDQIERNVKTYEEQCFKVLRKDRTEIRYNSEWLGKMNFSDVIKLSSYYTVARMLERDDFEKRYKSGTPISVSEFMYPLAQAYDSVAIKADIEVGGTDQTFNLLVGRDIMREFGLEPQVIMTFPILEGTDGVNKMSKSLGNYIGFMDEPNDMFGKVMSISDELMFKYYELLTDLSNDEIQKIKDDIKNGALHPKKAKVQLAKTIVAYFYDYKTADRAEEEFNNVFKNKQLPEDIQTFEVSDSPMNVVDLIMLAKLAPSKSEAKRLIKSNAVKLNDSVVNDFRASIDVDGELILRVGKRRFAKIVKK